MPVAIAELPNRTYQGPPLQGKRHQQPEGKHRERYNGSSSSTHARRRMRAPYRKVSM